MNQNEFATLTPFATTPRSLEILNAVIAAEGDYKAAAQAVGLTPPRVRGAVSELRAKAAKAEPAVHAKQAPPGYLLKGVSTLLDRDGNVAQTWVKTTRDSMNLEALIESFKVVADLHVAPKRMSIPPPAAASVDHLLTVYPWGDPHIGMLAWPAETGNDFNLDIATRQLFEAVDKLVALAPPSKTALILNLGDFFHSDNMQNRTARSGHALDVDGRWFKILNVGIAMVERCIDRALQKHQEVIVDNRIGNHDDHSSAMLTVALSRRYHNEPRVKVNVSPNMFYYLEFGQNLIGCTHGHTVKADKLPGVMACDKSAAWGRTKHRYWYTGHVHHESKKEYPGCIVETFRTLAARDAWHHGQGYRAGRSMVCDVLHAERGRILRHEIGVEDLSK
jgi:hypothetical protein